MSARARTALLVGATGLVGGHCLRYLLDETGYARVTALTRRKLPVTDDRLRVRVVDFDRLDPAAVPAVDDVYLCLGTTRRDAGSREAFRRVDHTYPVTVARLAGSAGARRLALVSSIGAKVDAWSFYLRTKGEAERDVAAGYDCVEIFRPSLLRGERARPRPGEVAAGVLADAVSWSLVGRLRDYRPIPAGLLAAAMVEAVRRGEPGRHVRTYDGIRRLAAHRG